MTTRTIRKLLVANRGEIARRIFRTVRAMGIGTAAVYADPDRDAPHAREADVAVALPGRSAAETYLAIDALVAAARRAGADAVHPGYGFLAENAGFARAVIAAGLTWVGPSPESIAAMGDKLGAKRLAAQAGVPMLPSQAIEGLDAAAIARAANEIGFPVLVKAAGGGGGRGMRIVRDAASLADAVAAARREAGAAFGDERVFLERYLAAPRHVEVQILGDRHGNLVHLGERECSIQRRHQKVIEEAPSPAVDAALRTRLTDAALALARAIGYESAGTVELLLDGDGRFYFLEVNTRIQVEHPVTEAVTGLDLVREQILVAEGHPLAFGQDDVALRGHAIEVRLYAEDPAGGFLPTGGRLLDWRAPDGIRVDGGVEAGTEIAVAFDPMIAKVVAHAPTRREAAMRLAGALERLIAPGVVSNRDFLVSALRHPAFLSGDTTTDFIERHAPALARTPSDDEVRAAGLAAALAAQMERRAEAPVLRTIASGWRNNPSAMQGTRYRVARGADREIAIGYLRGRGGAFRCDLDGVAATARIVRAALPEIDVEIDGLRHAFRVTRDGSAVYVQDARGEFALDELPRFPEPDAVEHAAGGCVAPMPGKVLDVRVKPGDAVARGQGVLTMEAMKMEHLVTAPSDGVVAEVRVAAGQQVDAGLVLIVIDARDGGSPDGR